MNEYRVIIAGGRYFNDYILLKERCDYYLQNKLKESRVVILSGHASGADTLGEHYAQERGLECELHPADWKAHGRAAGPIRNKEMAEVADALIAFWDGQSRGTASMINLAKSKGLKVAVVNYMKSVQRQTPSSVDLGLPSGLKWATCNVGANNPEESGFYFQWGEARGYSVNDGHDFDERTYKSDVSTWLVPEKDAATTILGREWRTPKPEEWEELYNNCYCVWVDNYSGTGAAGMVFFKAHDMNDKGRVSNILGRYTMSDAHIFLSAIGYLYRSRQFFLRKAAYYWSSAGYPSGNACCYLFHGEQNEKSDHRCQLGSYNGMPVRAVT